MKTTSIAIALALLLPLLLSGSAVAAPPSAPQQVPLKGSVQADESYALEFPMLQVDGQGSGNATHLGRFTVRYQAVVQLLPDGTGTASVTAVLVAANGDQLFAEGSGQATLTSTPNVDQIEETYTITGGTGRFTGASGSFTIERVVNLATGKTSGELSGVIVMH